jgi:hypothetical protein
MIVCKPNKLQIEDGQHKKLELLGKRTAFSAFGKGKNENNFNS